VRTSIAIALCLVGCHSASSAEPPDITGSWQAVGSDLPEDGWCIVICGNGRLTWGESECGDGDATSFAQSEYDGETLTAIYGDGTRFPMSFIASGDTAVFMADGHTFTLERTSVPPALCDNPSATLIERLHS